MKQHNNIITTPLFWRNSLAGKFVTLTVAVVFILMSISAYMNFQAQEEAIIDNLKTQNTMLGNFMASIASEAVLSYDFDALNEYMKEIGNGEDIVYAAIFSPDGSALTSYVQRRNSYISELLNDKHDVDIRRIIDSLNENPDIIHQRYPILFEKKVLGNFVIGISKTRVEADHRQHQPEQRPGVWRHGCDYHWHQLHRRH